MTRTRMPGWVAALLGGVALVLVWWIFALTVFTPAEGTTFTPVPTPVAVFQWLFVQGNIAGTWSVFAPTLAAAGIGYLWGNGIALLLATIVLLFPKAETVITQIAVVIGGQRGDREQLERRIAAPLDGTAHGLRIGMDR